LLSPFKEDVFFEGIDDFSLRRTFLEGRYSLVDLLKRSAKKVSYDNIAAIPGHGKGNNQFII